MMFNNNAELLDTISIAAIIILTGGFFYLIKELRWIRKVLTDKLLNDTYNKLLELMYKRMRGIGVLTNAEKALHAYMRRKILIVYKGYKEAKKDIGILTNPTFVLSIIQEGLAFLNSSYDFPTEFFNQVEKINKEGFEQFKSDFIFDYKTASTKSEKQAKLVYHLMGAVETNIVQIIAAFERSKALIIDPNFLEVYPTFKSKIILKENVSTDYLEFTSNISVKVDKMKELIATGDKGLRKAIDLLIGFTHSDSNLNNELISVSARLASIEESARQATSPHEEIIITKNKIRESLLEIITNINQTL